MPHEWKSDGLDQRGAAAALGASDRLTARTVHRDRIIAVNMQTGHAVGGSAICHSGAPRRLGISGVFAVAIVLTDENHRQLPHSGEIERLIEDADIRRTVA